MLKKMKTTSDQEWISAELALFPDWVRQQHPGREYDYMELTRCAIAQFMTHLGYDATVTPTHISIGTVIDRVIVPLPEVLDDAVSLHPWTFGALAERLSAAGL